MTALELEKYLKEEIFEVDELTPLCFKHIRELTITHKLTYGDIALAMKQRKESFKGHLDICYGLIRCIDDVTAAKEKVRLQLEQEKRDKELAEQFIKDRDNITIIKYKPTIKKRKKKEIPLK